MSEQTPASPVEPEEQTVASEGVKKTETPDTKPPSPWKNTFFWFAAILFVLAVLGLIGGQDLIRDPGQVRENGLVWIYLGGALVMVINGWLTHRQAVRAYHENEG